MVNWGDVAALVAVFFFAVLVCAAVYVLIRLARLLTEARRLVADMRTRSDGVFERAQAVIHLALAPKSNAVVKAIGAAQADVRAGLAGTVPAHLRDAHYAGAGQLGHGEDYQYPHDFDEGVVTQRYAPDSVADRVYYQPSGHGNEARVAERASKIRAILRRR